MVRRRGALRSDGDERRRPVTERRDEPVSGEVIEGPPGPTVHAYRWEWSDVGGPRGRSRLPWFGIFLVVFGILLLGQLWFPALATAGSLVFLAVGVAFLVSWVVNRGVASLYLGSIIVALAAPGLLAAAGIVNGAGVGTFSLGVAFLFIALIRWVSGSGIGWQAALGGLLIVIGATSIALPSLAAIVWPLALVIVGGFLLFRASRRP
jgi:hypothetical protein